MYETLDSWSVFARIVRECIKPHWRLFAISAGCMAITSATSGAMPLLLQRMGDDVFVGKNPTLLALLPILVVLVITVRALCGWLGSVADASLGTKIVAELRFRMFDTIAAADLAWIQGFASGRFVSACLGDTASVNAAGTKIITGVFQNGLTVIFLLCAMFYLDWRLSLVVLLGAPFAIVNLTRQKKRIKHATGRTFQESGILSGRLTQTLQSMRVVKAYGQEATETMRLREAVRRSANT